jgi:hypothetical protein
MPKPVTNRDGVIVNAMVLKAEQVATLRVLCPLCGDKVFEMWPEGWDAHASHRCQGLTTVEEMERKAEFKAAAALLFR